MYKRWFSGKCVVGNGTWPGFEPQVLQVSILFFKSNSYVLQGCRRIMFLHHLPIHASSIFRSKAGNWWTPWGWVNRPTRVHQSQQGHDTNGPELLSPYLLNWDFHPPWFAIFYLFSYILFFQLYYFLCCFNLITFFTKIQKIHKNSEKTKNAINILFSYFLVNNAYK